MREYPIYIFFSSIYYDEQGEVTKEEEVDILEEPIRMNKITLVEVIVFIFLISWFILGMF